MVVAGRKRGQLPLTPTALIGETGSGHDPRLSQSTARGDRKVRVTASKGYRRTKVAFPPPGETLQSRQASRSILDLTTVNPALILALIASAAFANAATIEPSQRRPAERARSVLQRVVTEDRSWVGVHAAEALAALGEGRTVHERFLLEASHAGSLPHRIGIWRVLAATTANTEERAAWIARIEQVFLDPDAPDRKQAIESLAKLGHRTTGAVLAEVRRAANAPASMNRVLPLWSLHYAGDPAALDQLLALLRSDDPVARQRSAYALRWIQPAGPAARAALVQAVKLEPAGTPRVFLVSAALTLDADPAQRASWQNELQTFFHGDLPTGRLEAAQALAPFCQPADLPRLEALLDDADHDRRVAAAAMILHLLAPARSEDRPGGLVK